MEFLDGEELRYVLKREKVLSPARLVRMLAQVAIGLDEAHARGFIHRDLKPDNLFLCGTREGDKVKLLDFGSVKDTSSNNRKKLTVLGTTIGSPYYMAPEQAQGLGEHRLAGRRLRPRRSRLRVHHGRSPVRRHERAVRSCWPS